MPIMLTVLIFYIVASHADPAVIGNAEVPPLDRTTLQRIYTGKTVEINGTRVIPINLPPDNMLRTQFLQDFLGQDENTYTGYWTVRRYIGKGAPPQELHNSAEVTRFVINNVGAIGYIDESELTSEIKVLLRK